MINKEIEAILETNVDIITYKADKDFRCLTSTEKTLLKNNERIKQYIDQLENKVKEVEQVRDKLEFMDYYCTPEALEDLDKILGDDNK